MGLMIEEQKTHISFSRSDERAIISIRSKRRNRQLTDEQISSGFR